MKRMASEALRFSAVPCQWWMWGFLDAKSEARVLHEGAVSLLILSPLLGIFEHEQFTFGFSGSWCRPWSDDSFDGPANGRGRKHHPGKLMNRYNKMMVFTRYPLSNMGILGISVTFQGGYWILMDM